MVKQSVIFQKNWRGPSASFQKTGGARAPPAPMDGTPIWRQWSHRECDRRPAVASGKLFAAIAAFGRRRERVSSRVAHSRILLAGPERMRRKQEARNKRVLERRTRPQSRHLNGDGATSAERTD